jgi:signal transduction histidine kinase
LTGILSNAQAAQRILTGERPDLEVVQDALLDVVADTKRTKEVLDWVRSLLRREKPNRESLDVRTAIQEILTLLRCDTRLKNVAIVTEISDPLPRVLADRVQIQQVLVNLVLNAAQAMAESQKEERRLEVIVCQSGKTDLRVSIKDTGTGFSTEALESSFDFFRTGKPGGLGVGLAICRSIVEAHGGRIWLENNPDGGARVNFTLPGAGADPNGRPTP